MSFFDQAFYGNTFRQWAIGLAVVVGVVVVLKIILAIVVGRLGAMAKRTKTDWDDVIYHAVRKTRFLILLAAGLYAGSHVLKLSDPVQAKLTKAIVVVGWLQVGLWLSSGFRYWVDSYRERKMAQDTSAATIITAIGFVGRIVLWSIVILIVLDNLGVQITALVAGFGVGGIAIALAVQHVLGDVLASMSIAFDKPFAVGDYLTIGDLNGTVESVGLRTTRLRSLSGEQLVFSNTDLIASRIRNYGRMSERRVAFTIGVTYQTPREKLERIPQILREVVEAQDKARFGRSHFKEYGNSAINFETVYFVLVADYDVYMDVQQAINLLIHARFEREGIEFAYPTQTLHIVGPSQ